MEMKKSNKRTQDFGGKSSRAYLWIECKEWGNKSRVSPTVLALVSGGK